MRCNDMGFQLQRLQPLARTDALIDWYACATRPALTRILQHMQKPHLQSQRGLAAHNAHRQTYR
jgi:hypothetical protein